MQSGKEYHYDMGFAIDGVPIPDPQSFSGESSQLDTLGERNANGDLIRNLVATKRHPSIEYETIDWEMIRFIGNQVRGKEFFYFTYPDPFEQGGVITIYAYTADMKWKLTWAPTGGAWIGDLKFNAIEK